MLTTENENEVGISTAVRRIQLKDPTQPIMWDTNEGIIRSVAMGGTSEGGKSGVVPLYLMELYHDATKDRSEEEKTIVSALLRKYSTAFSEHDQDLGFTTLVHHAIDTGDARPIKQPPRRVPFALAGEEQKVIREMENQGVIQRSCSPWASPLVLVRKKSGKIRPCVDYRRLNSVTRKDAYPLSRIQECLDTVSGASLFSTFDLTSGYHQVPMRNEDIPKTAFATKHGLYEFKSMPFGLCNSPATFQRLMELVLHGLQWQTCLIYLDDVIVYSSTFDEHIRRIEGVLERVNKAGLKLKPEKCQLLKPDVTFLGHIVSGGGIRPNPDNVQKLVHWPTPKNITEVRQVLGMGSYYRRFIRNFSTIVSPLTNLLKKGTHSLRF